MKGKNRFSSLLKHLMTLADVKNYALAKELQFDESYVSKMISGSLMPPKKTSEKVMRTISRCIVNSLDDESRQTMMSEYQITRAKDLEAAIYDNLMAEYLYVVGLKEETGSEIPQKTSYFPELTLAQFMQKTRHPALRQVKALDVITAMDILSLDRHYQLALAELESSNDVVFKSYPNVHFSMLINLDGNTGQNVYNVSFLLNLLTNLSDIDFQLYSWPQAVGKLVFAIREAYSIAGMIIDENHCISVTVSEDDQDSNAIYDRLRSLCSSESMVVRKVEMEDMLQSNDYIRFLLNRNQRWLLGEITEQLLPEDLFEELLTDYCKKRETDEATIRRIHSMTGQAVQEMGLRALICEKAMTDFAVSGVVDFFNTKVELTPEQRLHLLAHISEQWEKNHKIQVKILRSGAITDTQHIPEPTMFVSDSMGYLRLRRFGPENNVSVFNRKQMTDMCRDFFDEVWDGEQFRHIEKPDDLRDFMYYLVQMVKIQIHN